MFSGQSQSGSLILGSLQSLQSSGFIPQVSHLYPHSTHSAYSVVASLSVYPSIHKQSGAGPLRDGSVHSIQLVVEVTQVAHLQSHLVQSMTPSVSSK